MTCEWCHEFTPRNRKDGFCSDICKEWSDRARAEQRERATRTTADPASKEGRMSSSPDHMFQWSEGWV